MAPTAHYERRRPEQTARYRLVQRYAKSFFAHVQAAASADLLQFVKDEFDAFHPPCAGAPAGAADSAAPAAAAQPRLLSPAMQVARRVLTRFLIERAGRKQDQADSAVTS
jgi:hypothetical protein